MVIEEKVMKTITVMIMTMIIIMMLIVLMMIIMTMVMKTMTTTTMTSTMASVKVNFDMELSLPMIENNDYKWWASNT